MYQQNIVAGVVLLGAFLAVQGYDFAGYALRARRWRKERERPRSPR